MGGAEEAGPLGAPGSQAALKLDFRPLGPANGEDLLEFFAGPAFADNPHWASCFCAFHNTTCSQQEWARRTAAENRALKSSLIAAGRTNGVLAYDAESGEVVGWVHADRRPNLVRLDAWEVPADEAMGAIVCYVVRPDRRRRGVASGLLEAAARRLRVLGCGYVEAYPLSAPRHDERLSAEAVEYHGPRAMYERAGYGAVEVSEHGFTRVRLRLT